MAGTGEEVGNKPNLRTIAPSLACMHRALGRLWNTNGNLALYMTLQTFPAMCVALTVISAPARRQSAGETSTTMCLSCLASLSPGPVSGRLPYSSFLMYHGTVCSHLQKCAALGQNDTVNCHDTVPIVYHNLQALNRTYCFYPPIVRHVQGQNWSAIQTAVSLLEGKIGGIAYLRGRGMHNLWPISFPSSAGGSLIRSSWIELLATKTPKIFM